MAAIDYPVFFALAAALAIGLYVVLDGFDLGVGVLFVFAPRDEDRDLMMRSLAPLWDGNETWLVMGAMVLLAGFPAAFAILLPAFYAPVALMLLGLVLRGVAFEFRSQGGLFQKAWTIAFAGGSTLAAFCQGAILGAFLQGPTVSADFEFAGGPLDCLAPFPIATGLGVVAAYAALGAGWLIWRTEGSTQIFAREIARPALLGSAAAVLLVSLWTPFILPSAAARWFGWPGLLLVAPLPLTAAVAWIVAWRSLWNRRDWLSFVATIVLFVTALAGLGISVWPDAIPGALTIWAAASTRRTQEIVALGLIMILPIILAYVGFGYWVFRGKVTPGGAYDH